MNFNKHSAYEGQHAFLGASNYHWLNYSDEKLASTYRSLMAKARGTELHEFAAQCIRLGQKLPKTKNTLNMYVNDAIGYKMTPEVVLFHSDNWFGTADTISFRNKFLRIHDYKSGVTPAKMEQLEIYAALFCLEYKQNPEEFKGHVGDISAVIRMAVTGRVNSPDMFTVMNILGKEKCLERLENALNNL